MTFEGNGSQAARLEGLFLIFVAQTNRQHGVTELFEIASTLFVTGIKVKPLTLAGV